MSKPFRERNPVIIGAISFAVIAAFILAAFKAESLPVIGGGDTYYAAFTEVGGLKPNDEVRVAGVRVGKVKEIVLDGDHVKVRFLVEGGVDLGEETRAEVKVKTLLGAMFLALVPEGEGQLDEGAEIPMDRTSSPYDVVEAFSGLAEQSTEIDTDQLAEALNVFASLSENTPEEFRDALRGLSRLSENLADRDAQITALITNLRSVTGVLGERSDDIVTLMEQGNVLFQALTARRDSIHNLLTSTSELSRELSALVKQSRTDLKPALDKLDDVVQMLLDNQEELDSSLRLMAPFYRVFSSTLGNGPWFDTIVTNMPPVPSLGGN